MATDFDAHSNFGYSKVASIDSPVDQSSRLTVRPGEGSRFPSPPFNATIWQDRAMPEPSNSTIVRVTAINNDTLTFSRNQENSGNRSVLIGDQIAATITKKTLEDIETLLLSLEAVSTTEGLNVKSYGAIGDGVTDDTAAINTTITAANAAGGGVVFFPEGTYLCNSRIVPKSYVTLRGLGYSSQIKRNANDQIVVLTNGALNHFTVEKLRFTGPVNEFPTTPRRTRTVSGVGASFAIYLRGDQDPGTPGAGPISNIKLCHNIFENMTELPILIAGTTGTVRVTDNDFVNNKDPGFIFNDEVIFNDNHCRMGADNGVSLSRGNKKVTCIGNTIENMAYQGIFIAGFDIALDGDVANIGPTNFTVTGNTIKNCGLNGIFADGAPERGVISSNTVDQGYYRGPSGSTTIAAGSNGQTLPQATIHVASTLGFSSTGSTFRLNNETITFTGITDTSFTGCTGGTSTLSTGQTVSMPGTDINSVGIYVAGYPFPYTAATTIAAGSNGAALPQATINVASTAGYPVAGSFQITGPTIGSSGTITYTGKTATTLTGCSGGTGTMTTADTVTMIPSAYAKNIQVIGNTLSRCGRAGVEVFAAQDIDINDNKVYDCGTQYLVDGVTSTQASPGNATTNIGILVRTGCARISARDNSIVDTRAIPYTNQGIIPSTLATIPTDFSFSNNRMSGFSANSPNELIDYSNEIRYYGGTNSGAAVQLRRIADIADNTVVNVTPSTNTTIAAGSNGVQLPQSTISVASTANFPLAGVLKINNLTITYTNVSGNDFTGCTTSATGTLRTGDPVYAVAPNFLNVQGAVPSQNVAFAAESFSETNVGITFRSKGTGQVVFRTQTDAINGVQFRSGDNASVITNFDSVNKFMGVRTSVPTRPLDVVGEAKALALMGYSIAPPTAALGAGLNGGGTGSPTITVTGSNVAGKIVAHAGSGGNTANATVATITFGTPATQIDGAVTMPQNIIQVDSTEGFPSFGTFTCSGNTITYTGITVAQFTGCTTVGTPTLADNAPVVAPTFAYPVAPAVILTPAAGATAALPAAGVVYVDQAATTTTQFVLKVGGTAIADNADHVWNYHVIG